MAARASLLAAVRAVRARGTTRGGGLVVGCAGSASTGHNQGGRPCGRLAGHCCGVGGYGEGSLARFLLQDSLRGFLKKKNEKRLFLEKRPEKKKNEKRLFWEKRLEKRRKEKRLFLEKRPEKGKNEKRRLEKNIK